MSTEKAAGAPRYITPEGFRRISEEHQQIWTVSRPRVVAEVEAAAALGDRSENAEYVYGKKKLRELDRRLRHLSERMDSLTVVAPTPHPSGRAYFGAWVTVEHDPRARTVAFVRVTPERRAVHMRLRVEPLAETRCRLHIAWQATGIDAARRDEARAGTENGLAYAVIAAGIAATAERFLQTGRAFALAPNAVQGG